MRQEAVNRTMQMEQRHRLLQQLQSQVALEEEKEDREEAVEAVEALEDARARDLPLPSTSTFTVPHLPEVSLVLSCAWCENLLGS